MRAILAAFLALMLTAPLYSQDKFREPGKFKTPNKFRVPGKFEVPAESPEPEKTEAPAEHPKPEEKSVAPLAPVPDPFASPTFVGEIAIKAMAAASAAPSSPMDASVSIKVDGKDKRQAVGSGTIIASDDRSATIITAAHLFRGIDSPSIQVRNRSRLYAGTLAKADYPNDVAIVSITCCGGLPFVEMSLEKPKPGDAVESCALGKMFEDPLEPQSHKVTAIDKYSAPRNIETDGAQREGRSGGGLFFNGRLCGVIQGRTTDNKHSLYVSLEPVRSLLMQQVYGAPARRIATLIMADFKCIPCENLDRALGAGSDLVEVRKVVGPQSFMTQQWFQQSAANGNGGYPFVSYIDSKGKQHVWGGIKNLDQLERSIETIDPQPKHGNQNTMTEPAFGSSEAVGVTIQGAAFFRQMLSIASSTAGDGSTAHLIWTRGKGAKEALLISNPLESRMAVFGESGRVEFSVKAKNNLPISRIAFNYRFGTGTDGKPRFYPDLDEIECLIPEEGKVGAAQVVGEPFMIAWTVISIVYDIYQIMHPTIDLFLGPEVRASGTLSAGNVAIEFEGNQPSVRAHWQFMLGLIRAEYSRLLTGVQLSPERVLIEFHKSRFYRDVTVPVQ